MKYALIILLFSISVISYAQTSITRGVTLLKSSPKIDSLILAALKAPSTLKTPEMDSCFLLSMTSPDDNALFSIHTTSNKTKIYALGDFEEDEALGYFIIKGCLVFVNSSAYMGNFFTYTESKRQFTFIKPADKDDTFWGEHFSGWMVQYKNGLFICKAQ